MFRNEKIQRAIAAFLITTFSTGTIAQTVPRAPVPQRLSADDVVPLKRHEFKPQRDAALLPLDTQPLAPGKGQRAARSPRAANSDGHAQALSDFQETAGRHSQLQAERIKALREQYRAMQQLEVQADGAFAATEAKLRAAHLPAEIMERQRAAAAGHKARSAELRAAMGALDEAAAGRANSATALTNLSQLLSRYPSRTDNGKKSPAKLPWGHGKHKLQKVALTERQHERLFPRSIELAAAGSISGITLPDAILGAAPVAGDLAASEEVQLTPEIRALATKLSNNPVQIYNWVRNNIAYTVGYGAMQGAAATLENGRGNAYDTASLLIALYRAAQIPARYVYGTVEVPAARLQIWLGVNNTAAAQALLGAAGIPNRATEQGGQAGAIQFEHVWVQALVDYGPGRGATSQSANAWVQLDASFKLGKDKAALDLRSAVSLNEAALLDTVKAGAVCTATSAQSLNATNLQAAYAAYTGKLSTFLATQGADLSVGDVLGNRTTTPENYSILLGTLPYKTVATGAIVNVLPDALRWQFRFQLYANGAAQAQGQATATLAGSLTALAGKRLTLSFAPATQADADTLAAFMPAAHANGSAIVASEFPSDVPGYLIKVKAELRSDGALVASGGSFLLGSDLLAEIGMFEADSGSWNSDTVAVHAGDYQAVAIDAQGIGAAQLNTVKARLAANQAKIAAGQAATLSRDDLTGDILHQSALAYFATSDSNAAVFQRASGVVAQRLPSFGRAIAGVKPQMALGIINKVSFPGVTLAIDRMDSAVATNTGGLPALAFERQRNERDSAYGHLVLAKLFSDAQHPAAAVSAVKALAAAATQGQKIYTVTSANLAPMLPLLALSNAATERLQAEVGAGRRVLLAQGPVSIGNWIGYPLQIEDTNTGAGAYQLIDDVGSANAGVFPTLGMGWLALAQPFQAGAAIAPAMQAGQAVDSVLASTLNAQTTRWSFFSGQADVANGLFLAHIAAAQGTQACDAVTGILAANLGTATGFDQGGATSITAAPIITSVPLSAGTAASAYRYAASATDPQNLPITWSLPEAPGAMHIGATGIIAWDAPLSGSYTITVRADNGRAYAEQRYLLTVGGEAIPLEISLAVTPAIVNTGENVTVTLLTNGGTGNVARTLSIDGAAVALNGAGQATITGTVQGAHQLLASATDSQGTTTKTSFYSVRVPLDVTAPAAQITSPIDDAEVTAPLTVTGTAADANLAYYQLLLRATDGGEWQEIARGTKSVTNGALGKVDPTQLRNGIYDLMLNVVDANGQKTTAQITLDIYRDLKIGQFSISFEDLNIDASGIPVRVTRTYDTRRKGQSLDFGFGWSVDYQNLQISKNMVLGAQWTVKTSQVTICLAPDGKRKINITLPDGKVERFTAANKTECQIGAVPLVDVQFTGLAGTNSQLELDNPSLPLVQGGMLYDPDGEGPWNPLNYKLTTEDHYVYYLTDGIGITRVVDPAGNTLTYGQNGIVHSNGLSVAFTRDTANRITSITDPAGKAINYAYSATGDLTVVTDRGGATSRFTYNRSHGLVNYTDPRGIVTARYTYDADGRLIAVTDAAGKSIEMTNNQAANQQTVKDRRGNSTTYTYDNAGNVVEVRDALGNKTTTTYDALGNEASVTDALGKVTLSTFDARSSKQLTQKDPLGNTTRWDYDPALHRELTATTDARGNVTQYQSFESAYWVTEPLGRMTRLVNKDGNLAILEIGGHSTRFGYDALGNKTSETDGSGNVTTYAYDANNKEIGRNWTRMVDGKQVTVSSSRKLDASDRVIEETDALGFTTKTTYDAGGQVTSATDPQGRVTGYNYDNRGKLAKISYPDGFSESVGYDANGNQVSTTDRQGRTTFYEYDALNRQVKTVFADGTTAGTSYDEVGRIAATTDANGKSTANGYDDAGRLISVTGPDGKSTRFAYDPNGNRTDVWDANDRHTQYAFDALNRLVTTIRPDGKSATTVWNVSGTKQSEIDFGGNATAYGYDAMGRLSQVTQTNGTTEQVTVYGFDKLGNKISQQDAEGRITRWDYDAANRVTSRTLPGGQKESFTYDAAGNMTGKTDFAGKKSIYGYDALYQPSVTVLPDGRTVTRTFTASGQLASVSVKGVQGSGLQSGMTSYAYDAQDRLTRQTNPDGSFLAYAMDASGNITQRSTAAGTVNYTFDASQRLASVLDIAGGSTSYTYDSVGKLSTQTMPNGVVTRYGYDANGRLLQILHTKGSTIVTGVRYTLADNGQRNKMEEFDSQSTQDVNGPTTPSITRAYTYDRAGRLTQEQVSDRAGSIVRTTGYTYDKVGNRSKKMEATASGTETIAYIYDSNDRLSQETRTTPTGSQVLTGYVWDANGNLGAKTVGTSLTLYLWNGENRLVEVKEGSSTATAKTRARYGYDSRGNRVTKAEPGVSGQPDTITTYLVDDTFAYAQTVQESVRSGTNTASVNYVWGASLIEQIRGDQIRFYHSDALGSVKALSDSTGTVKDEYKYDGFGAVEDRTGSTENAYRYTGEYLDDAVGIQYNRARWYDVSTGRFESLDGFDGYVNLPISLNKYAYANSNPVSGRDPSGSTNLYDQMATVDGSNVLSETSLTAGRTLGQQFKKKLVCEAAELIETGGVYIFIEEIASGVFVPYIGQGAIGARIAAHEVAGRIFGQFFIFVEIGGGEAARRAAEQVLINKLSGFLNGLPKGWSKTKAAKKTISNLINSISPKRWLPMCK